MKPATKPERAETTTRDFSPMSLFSEWVRQGTESYFAAQRILLDLAVRQNDMALNTLRGRFAAQPSPAVAMTELAGQGVSNFIAAQKTLLDTAALQLDVNLQAARRTMDAFAPMPAQEMAELTRQGVESFVAAQQALLDVVTRPWRTATAPNPN